MGPTHCVWIDCVSGAEMGLENRILGRNVSVLLTVAILSGN
jgi:hypothetical protein